MEKQSRKATKHQRERIGNMLMSGQVDRNEAQRIIERTYTVSEARLMFWEDLFPHRGQAILDHIGKFYDSKFELKPSLPELEDLARDAIFWKKNFRIRAFRRSDAISLRGALKTDLRESINDSNGAETDFSRRTRRFNDRVNDAIVRFALKEVLTDTLNSSGGLSCSDLLYLSIGDVLEIAIKARLIDQGETSERSRSLINLCDAGNFPLGFDKDGKLLLLVAD